MNEFRPQNTGTLPGGEIIPIPLGGQGFSPWVTPLAANAVRMLPVIDHRGYGGMLYVIRADQPSADKAILVEFSDDGVTWFSAGQAIAYTQPNVQIQRALVPKGNYSRFSYTNGAVAQTSFRFEVILTTANIQQTLSSLNIPATDTVLAGIVKSIAESPDSFGIYGPIKRTGDAQNVFISNTDYAKEGTDSATAPALYSGATGTRGVMSSIWQLLQNGFAKFRLVDGNNNPLTTANGALSVTTTNPTPATDVSPLNKETTQQQLLTQLTGLLGKDFATQATEAAILSILGNGNQVTKVSNTDYAKEGGNLAALTAKDFATQATLALVLAQLQGINADQGTPSDAAVTDPTATAGEIALLKGVIKLLAAPLNVQGALTTTSFAYTTKSYNYGTTPAVTTTATTGVQTVKGSAGAIGGIYAINTASADAFISFWDLPAATPITPGMTAPTFVQPIDANVPLTYTKDRVFSNSIRFAVTTTYAGANIISLVYLDIDFR